MRQIRTEATSRDCSCDRMAVDAGVVHEDGLPFCSGRVSAEILLGGLLLLVYPGGKILRGLRVDAKQHLGVLRPTVLCTLSEIETCLGRIHPHYIDAVWNHIHLSRKAWHPEAMGYIGGRHRKVGRCGCGGVADRNMEFVGCYDTKSGIAILPPELMADDDDVHRAGGFGDGLGSKDDPRGCQKQHHDDQDRNHRPRKLNLVAAVDLRW